MKLQRFLPTFLVFFSILFSQTITRSELNPEYVKYLKDLRANRIKTITSDGHRLGYVPPPVKLHTAVKPEGLRKSMVFEARYDLRDYGLITSTKNQGNCGSCWTFATMGSLESNWLKTGRGEYNLSENNLKNGHRFYWSGCSGGNAFLSTSYLSRGAGPILEADDPYVDEEDFYIEGLDIVAYVGEAHFLPNDANIIKQALLDHGALHTNMHFSNDFYNITDNTYYLSSPDSTTNHAVLLIGWDDNKVTAGGTGAWIIRNSWGNDWGDEGCFFVSYNDAKINTSVACWPETYDFSSNNKIGQYDELGWVNNWGFNDDGVDYGLMRYTPENETISMVGTWAISANSILKIEVYDNYNGSSLSGKLAESDDFACEYAGFYTIPLNTPVTAQADDDLYIKVKYNTGTGYPIPAEEYSEEYADPVIDYGRYWLSSEGSSWLSTDGYDFDINIKVFSEYTTSELAAKFSASSTSGTAPFTVIFSDQSTGTPNAWAWDFGDGSSSNEQNPTHIYTAAGTYTVSLTVGDGVSTDTETKTAYIIVGSSSGISSTDTGGDWSEETTWIGGVVPTVDDNVIINGTVNVDQSANCNTLTINSGKILQNGNYNYTVNVKGDLYNNGVIRNNPNGFRLSVYVAGNVSNNGEISLYRMTLDGESDQILSMSSAAAFSNMDIYDSKSVSRVLAGSDLRFSDVYWTSNDAGSVGELVLPADSGYDLYFDGGYTQDTKIVANGNAVFCTGGHYFYYKVTLANAVLKDTINTKATDFTLEGDIVLDGVLQNTNYHYNAIVNGDLTINGIVRNNPAGFRLQLYCSGDLENNGSIQCEKLFFTGTEDQNISFGPQGEFRDISIVNNNSVSKKIAGSDLTFINSFIDFNDDGANGEIVAGAGNDLHFDGGYCTNLKITANGNAITTENNHYFYNNVTISDPVFKGTLQTRSNTFYGTGNVVLEGILQNSNYHYSLHINGGFVNNGTVQDNPAGFRLNLYVDGDLTNNGEIFNEYLYLDGESDQTLSMADDGVFKDVTIYDPVSASKVIAGSDLVFQNVIWNSNYEGTQGILELPAGSGNGLTFLGGYILSTKIEAHENSISLSDNAYIYSDVHIYEPVFHGNIQSNSNSFYTYGEVVVEDTLQNRNYHYSIKVIGDLINNGIIQNNPTGFTLKLEIDGDLRNNGVIENGDLRFLSDNDQNVYLVEGKEISAKTYFYANKGSGSYQWYKDGIAIENATSSYYLLDEITANNYGSYYCSTNEGNSQTITISGKDIVVIPDILTVEYGPAASANVWEKFIIPLTADNFSVSEEVFAAAMKQISMIRIRTEMSNSQDNGSLDVVKLGDTYESNFTTGTEDWTLMGDGTLSWSASGGVSGGYLSIADWATGDWHWAVVPTEWTGDISTLIGDNLEFYFKTDHPDYSAVVEFHTGEANRIVMTAEKMNLAPGESTEISVTLNPPAESAITVTLSSSSTDYITVPASLSIPAGSSSATFTATATAEISTDGSSVVSASAAGYSTARLTITVSQAAGTTLSGIITDATTGNPLQNTHVELAGISTTSNEEGYYILEGVPAGVLTAEFAASPTRGNSPLLVQFHDYSTENTQTVTANLDGYINYVNRQVRVIEGEANTLDISLSPILTEGILRFVLSWDDDPVDLDSYIHTPDIEGDDYFVYYYRKGSSDSPPYTILDVDDTDGYGPETITIHRTFSGIYKYFVHKYAGTESITQSNAVVHIYDETGLIHTVHVPATGEGDYWEVCDIDGDTKNFTLINEIKTQSPFVEDGSMLSAYAKGHRPAESLSSGFSWEWDFGDGESSSEQNPQHIYSTPGYYTVTLTVSNGDSSSTEVKENYIYVEESVTSIDTLLWESFEGEVTGWTLYDEDNDGNSWGIYTEEPPFDTVAHSGERGLGVKWNSAGNNDWIVTPQIYIPESGEILFSFWAHSNSADYPEDFNVKLATTGSALNNFDVTLEEVRQAPLAWTKYQYNLNDYRGATINLAVQCVSVDKYYLWSDDFLVTSGSTTAVDELPEILPATFALHQNYPNPFNPGTNIVYDLPANSMVHLEIFNIRGEMVEQLVSEYRPAGQHRVFWNAHNQPTGVYFIKLTAGEFISVRKMMFMK